MWACFTSNKFHVRALVIFLVFGFVGVCLSEVLRLTSHRETEIEKPKTPIAQPIDPDISKLRVDARGLIYRLWNSYKITRTSIESIRAGIVPSSPKAKDDLIDMKWNGFRREYDSEYRKRG